MSLLPMLGALLGACSSSDAPVTSTPSAGAGGQAPGGGGGATAGTASVGLAGSAGSAAVGGSSGSAPTGAAGSSSGGSVNAGGSAGSGTAGSVNAGGNAGSTSDFPDPASFVCNSVLGVSVTGDWYGAGFETGLPNDKWQVKWQSLSFVEQWADPSNAVWSQPVLSACASGSTNPDRVIFTSVNWTYTTEADWETQLTKVVETLKSKYSALRELDLMTMLRAPSNQVCGDPSVTETNEQVVKPIIDQALTAVGVKYPKLVRVLPPFFAPSCMVFQTNSPHFADGQAAVVAKVYRDYFLTH